MAFSAIDRIHEYIAGISLSVTRPNGSEVTIPAYYLSTLPDTVPAGNLPCRLIMPFAPRQQGTNLNFTTFGGGNQERVWQVSDILLYAAWGQAGLGVRSTVVNLQRYQVNYLHRLRTMVTFGGSDINATITDARDEIAVLNYPSGSGDQFHAVEMILTIHELIG